MNIKSVTSRMSAGLAVLFLLAGLSGALVAQGQATLATKPKVMKAMKAMGQLAAVSPESITIKTTKGEETFQVSAETTISGAKAALADLQAGDRVTVTYSGSSAQPMAIGIIVSREGVGEPQLAAAACADRRLSAYQKAACSAYQSEMAHEGKDCADAQTTYDINMCLGTVVETTHHNFDVFYQNLLLYLEPVTLDDTRQSQQRLKDTQELWLHYRDKTCEAVGYLWEGGTIRPSQEMSCDIRLTRSRMRDLFWLYDVTSHR